MALDFPNTPTNGSIFAGGLGSWTWDGAKWVSTSAQVLAISVSPSPPAAPVQGTLWWDSVGGQLYISFNDGNSVQWVIANSFPGAAAYLPLSGGTLTGALTVNQSPTLPTSVPSTSIWAIGPNGTNGAVIVDTFGGGTAQFTGRKARGTSAAPTAVQQGDNLSTFSCYGYGATAFSAGSQGRIDFKAAENWTDTAQGTSLYFTLIAPGTVSPGLNPLVLNSNSAVFNGSVTTGTPVTINNPGGYAQLFLNGGHNWLFQSDPSNNFTIYDNTAAISRLTISGTGIATFSTTVSAGVAPPGDMIGGSLVCNGAIATTNGGLSVGVYYSTGGWKYLSNAYGAVIAPSNGAIYFYSAPSGTAGNAASLTQTAVLDISGNLTTTGTVLCNGDFYLSRTSNSTGFLVRPNTSGYKNLTFAVSGAGPLDQLYLNSVATTYSGTFGPSSDVKLKEKIEAATAGHLAAIRQLKPQRYNRIGIERRELGLIAQEVEDFIPEAVGEFEYHDGERTKTIDLMSLITSLVGAVQELSAKVEALEGAR